MKTLEELYQEYYNKCSGITAEGFKNYLKDNADQFRQPLVSGNEVAVAFADWIVKSGYKRKGKIWILYDKKDDLTTKETTNELYEIFVLQKHFKAKATDR